MRFASLFLPLASLAGCRGEAQYDLLAYPDLALSPAEVDFGAVMRGETAEQIVYLENAGDLPMGVDPSSIGLGADGMEGSFSAPAWDAADITCPPGNEPAEALVDAGGAEALVLGGGCRLPLTVGFAPDGVGERYGSLHASTAVKTDRDSDELGFFPDPHNHKATILLRGVGLPDFGQIEVTPRDLTFAHVWPGGALTLPIRVRNVGEGPLALGEPSVRAGCASEFLLDASAYDGVLQAGESTLLQVTYRPESEDGSQCWLDVPSGDPEEPLVAVELLGNQGVDPGNAPPAAAVVSPPVGYVHATSDPLELRLHVFDADQPADTLTCVVQSYRGAATLASCDPTDESGYVTVQIPAETLYEGAADTLLVQVADQGDLLAYASTTALWGASSLPSDGDLDGYGDDPSDADPVEDCDDADPATYPGAAEVYDGADNDCNGRVDEDTSGSDDDGDSVSELGGDCDDNDPATYPGAPETGDGADNDCDGRLDEDTPLYDSDGDGYALSDGDCHDGDPAISPVAAELCDNIDNDCDGLLDSFDDEGCVPASFPPRLIGGCLLEDRALSVGESTTATVFAYDPDPDLLSYEWQGDLDLAGSGHAPISPSLYVQTITWTAPPQLPAGRSEETFSLALIVDDRSTGSDYCYDEITVYAEPIQDTLKIAPPSARGCGGEAAGLALLPLLGLSRRRRR